jgi:hypothetical protein
MNTHFLLIEIAQECTNFHHCLTRNLPNETGPTTIKIGEK